MTRSYSTHTLSHTTRWWIAALMVLSTVLFIAGVLVERSSASRSALAPVPQSAATAAPEGSKAREDQERQPAAAPPHQSAEGTAAHEEAEQNRVFGIDVEAPWLIAGVVIVSLLLIAALFVIGYRVLLLVVLVSLIAALFDGRELAYQLGQVHYGIAVLALAIVASRLATVVLEWLALREGRADTRAPAFKV